MLNAQFSPLVSIIIPVYNGSNYMKEAIDSALSQTYEHIEIIVVNDGSIDDTEKIAKSYGDKIRYFSKENGGVASALNLAIKEAKGEYISWLSHDDVYYPNKVLTQIGILSSIEDKNTILLSDIEMINSKSEITGKRVLSELYPKKRINNSLFLLLNGMVHGCTLLIKRSIFFEFNLFDESLMTVQDYSLWFNIFKKYKTYYVDKILIQSREHPDRGHNTLMHNTQNEQIFLWNKMVLGLTIKEVADIIGVPVKKLGAKEDIENIVLNYAPRKVLKTIYSHYNKDKFTAGDLNRIFSTLPQYRQLGFKDFERYLTSNLRAHFLLLKLLFLQKKNTILMVEPNPYHGETFAGYIDYFTKLGYNIHFVLDKRLKKEKSKRNCKVVLSRIIGVNKKWNIIQYQ